MTIHPTGTARAVLLALGLTANPAAGQDADTLSLADALHRAVEVAPSLTRAGADVDRADATTGTARSALFPSLAFSTGVTRFEEPMPVAPFHGFDLANAPIFDETLVQSSAGLRYILWDGGARGARIDGARAMESAAGARRQGVRQDVLDGLVEAYLAVLTARDVVQAQRLRIEELEAERERVQRFLDEGTAPRVDLLRAEAELSAARADEAADEARAELAEAELARLLEEPVSAVAGVPLADVSLGGMDPATAPDRPVDPAAVDAHPRVVAARSRADAARAGVREADAGWRPRLTATGAFNQFGATGTDFTYEWQGGLQVEYPLFTGGARGQEQERAHAEARAAEANVATARRDVRRGVDAARAAEREARARVAALDDAVLQFEELARVEALALEEGVGVQRDFLRAQAGLLQARAGLARARRAVILARVRLQRALGRLTVEWIDQHVEPVR